MIKVEFQTPAAGTPVKLQRKLGRRSVVSIDNVFNIDEDTYYEFFTAKTYRPDIDAEAVLTELDEIVDYQLEFIGNGARFFRVRALVSESCPNPCIIRTMLQHRVFPHRVYLNDGRHYNVIASIESWDHLKELGDMIESTYGGFHLDGINQHENSFFDCLQSTNIQDCLSDTQLELLKEAYSMGYFEIPRAVTADDVATQLNISQATFSEQLRKTLTQMLESMFGTKSRATLDRETVDVNLKQ